MEDPLPYPFMHKKYSRITLHNRDIKILVAITVCFLLGFSLIVFPHLLLETGKPGLWIIKLNSIVTQAPRGGFFGALVVLPQKTYFESVLLPRLREINKEGIEVVSQTTRNWLIMVWYGSSYI